MTNSVDLTNLRKITDGDRELEMSLFQAFCSSTETSLQALAESCADGQGEAWRTITHTIKGSAYNLGAYPMGDLCKIAQNNLNSSAVDKEVLLNLIKEEYIKVKAFLENIYP